MTSLSCASRSAVVGLLLAVNAAGQNRTFTSQYSFGDSLCDTGNVLAATNGTQPIAPYYPGRYSNGPVFTEMLGNPIAPSLTRLAPGPNKNFAFGGATAVPGGPTPTLTEQVAFYRVEGLAPRPTDLFTVMIGANDLNGIITNNATPGNPGILDVSGVNSARVVATNVRTLVGLGAKNLLVSGLPNLGATPRALQVARGELGLRATNAFNRELISQLAAIKAASPDVNLIYFDLQAVLDRGIADYRTLGFTTATSAYVFPAAQGGGQGSPNNYIFFDDIHPSSKTHALMAAIMLEELNPEPVVGFAATEGSAALALRGAGSAAVDERVRQVRRSNREIGRTDAYASFQYLDGDRDADGWRRPFDFQGETGLAGIDCRVADAFFLGAAVDFGRMTAKIGQRGGDFAVDDFGLRAYGIWHGGPLTVSLDADYGALWVKRIRRTTAFAGFQTNGKADGDGWGIGSKAAWALEGMNVTPWISLRTERVKIDGYTERDVAALMMDFDAQTAVSTAGAIGADYVFETRLRGCLTRFDARLAWHGELGSGNRSVSGRLADNFTLPTVISIDDGDGSGLEFGGAATLFLAKRWSASVGYTGDVRRNDGLASRAFVSVQTGF